MGSDFYMNPPSDKELRGWQGKVSGGHKGGVKIPKERVRAIRERIAVLQHEADHTLSGQYRLLCLHEIRGIRYAMGWKRPEEGKA